MVRSIDSKKRFSFRTVHAVGLLAAVAAVLVGLRFASAQENADTALAQTPLFVSESYPPLNMLVMARDHKLYYEAYNDASDLNGDGVIDVGYKPNMRDLQGNITSYYGNFNSNACYSYADGMFKPVAVASGANKKMCPGVTHWSGDFLNYLATSRMDAIRRVLYGGRRVTDTAPTDGTAASTVLEAAYIPRDAHSWGKAYDPLRDGAVYDIRDYAPLSLPAPYTRHLFAVTTLGEAEDTIPQLRVLNDSTFQVWDWVSKEGTAGQDLCLGGVNCAKAAGATYQVLPANAFQDLTITTWKRSGTMPSNLATMDSHFTTNATPANRCGSGAIGLIDTAGSDNNPFNGNNGCTQDNYLTRIEGKVFIPAAGTYTFAVDGDDAVDATIEGTTWGWYGGHGPNRTDAGLDTHKAEISFSTPGWKSVRFRHVEGTGGDNWGLIQKIVQPKSDFTNQNIRVEACASSNADLRESSCKLYANNGGTPIYRPTGLLHDFGENEKMYFGLLTGSYQKNLAGGTLRRNISSFADELDLQTGQFKAGVDGVVANMNRLRLIGYSGSYNPCGWFTDGPISARADPSICSMWGNPVAEMMFETTRYFSGAASAHSLYDYGNGNTKDKARNLAKPAWVSPYKAKAEGGGGYQHCAKPVMTVLSDINPSYDAKVPGSQYQTVAAEASALAGFSVSNEVAEIGVAEGIHGKNYFIGQSTSANKDGAPSVKRVDDLSWVRGLSPQEPSKEGTYYSAGVARFAANNRIFGTAGGKSGISTYSVAIASPLPEIRFPVGVNTDLSKRYVTIAPFAKSVTGSSIDPALFAPTNQIVDYYVDRIANTGTADADTTVNGGRPYAEFRINYEDVEQGADHDMDAISRYTVSLEADGKVKINMLSEYAAGGIGQHMGYVISGTTQDGMYLEVRDKDTGSVYYALNTPPNREPGYCVGKSSDTECATLGLAASRTFTVNTSSASATFLKGPLWYAAKYGMPGRLPSSVTGDPDNYFLVTNATTLKAQMTKAFNDIAQTNASVTAVSVDAPQSTLTDGAAVFRTRFGAEGWDGDVIRDNLTNDATTGLTSVQQWSAAERLAGRVGARKILYAGGTVAAPRLRAFTWAAINTQTDDAAWLTALNIDPNTNAVDNKAEQRISFLRGESHGLRVRKNLSSGNANVLGDIVNSTLVRVKGAKYIASAADKLEGTGSNYAAFVTSQTAKPEMIYVGANDGMLHAFHATTGDEEFAFIPSAMRSNLNLLTAPDYGKKGGLPHRYFVDGTPVVSDVYFGSAWHKVLIGSLGAGGRQVFALDVTDPTDPKLLWEFGAQQQPNMGHSLAQPTIARLNDVPGGAKGKWVALVPSGYQGANSSAGGASLFVLDIASGSLLKQFDLAGGMTDAELAASLPLGNGLSRVAAVDGDRDGQVDVAYAGDLLGNVWRFDLRNADSAQWQAKKFFTARSAPAVVGQVGARQPITAAPYVVQHPTRQGDLVIFGTGRMLTASDKSNTQKQSVYGVWDRYNGSGAIALPAGTDALETAGKARANLVQQSFTALTVDTTGTVNVSLSSHPVPWYASAAQTAVEKWGWYVDLPQTGEKMAYDMTLYGRGLFMSSVSTSEDPCTAGLSSMRYAIDPNTGGQTSYVPFDVNNDGAFGAADQVASKMVSGIRTSAAGQQTIIRGQDIDPGGNRVNVNPGVEVGRQSWRRQPPN